MIIVLSAIIFNACNDCSNALVKNISSTATVVRFDSVFYAINSPKTATDELKNIKKQDEIFFDLYTNKVYDMGISDTIPVELLFYHINSMQNKELKKRVDSLIGSMADERKEFDYLSKYFIYYFPESTFPKITTFYGGFAGFMAWLYNDSAMMVDLDMYLGADFIGYGQFFPQYKSNFFKKDMLVVNIAKELVRNELLKFEISKPENMLEYMVIEGAKIYQTNQLLPCRPIYDLMEYNKEQWEWNEREEQKIWQYIVKEKLLYESDFKEYRPLVSEGPATVRSGVALGAPPRIGVWAGYKIVAAFMENNDNISVIEMLQKYKPEDILAMSKYKP